MRNLYFTTLMLFCLLSACDNSESEKLIEVFADDLFVTIDENPLVDQVLGNVVATTSEGELHYSVVEQVPEGSFKIDSLTGVLSVSDSEMFNYELNSLITGVVKVGNSSSFDCCTVKINMNNIICDSIIIGEYVPASSIETSIDFSRDKTKPFDLNGDGVSDIKIGCSNSGGNNRDYYYGIFMLNDSVEIARSITTKNANVEKVSHYDKNDWKGSYALSAEKVEWPIGLGAGEVIDNTLDWVNSTFFISTHSSRDALQAYLDLNSIKKGEYIAVRIRTNGGCSYGYALYSHNWNDIKFVFDLE